MFMKKKANQNLNVEHLLSHQSCQNNNDNLSYWISLFMYINQCGFVNYLTILINNFTFKYLQNICNWTVYGIEPMACGMKAIINYEKSLI